MTASLHRRARVASAVVFILAVCSAAGAFADDAKKGAADLKKLQGSWTTPSGGGGDDVVYTFKDDKLTVAAPSRTYTITVTLDDAAKPHKAMDMKIDQAPDDAKGQTVAAIYKLDGDDKAQICFRPGGERPDKFEQVGFEQFVVELKRKKG
jgi:uncharacterized protein (TIGR03067 family)